MSRRVVLLPLVALVASAPAIATEDPLMAYRKLTTVEPPCNRDPQGTEIVVCARRDADRYRLPLPTLSDDARTSAAIKGEVPRATTQLVVIGDCGIFAGQRKCTKFETRGGPLAGGKDPITALVRLGQFLVDAEAVPVTATKIPDVIRR